MLRAASSSSNLSMLGDADRKRINRCRFCRSTWKTLSVALFASAIVSLLLIRSYYNLEAGPVWQPQSEPTMPTLQNLVVVAGHAVYIDPDFSPDMAEREDSWYLLEYQQEPGIAASFVEMIQQGVSAAAQDPSALLLFSGAPTRAEAGPLSEAASYWRVANAADWYGMEEVRDRSSTEDYARDSFENLLFSLCRFKELTGKYPVNVTIASYKFKRQRFEYGHRKALRFPHSHFFYAGTHAIGSPHIESVKHLQQRQKGEALTVKAFEEDPYGCSRALRGKRQARNPFARTIPYSLSCPEIDGLLKYCGPSIYDKALPWTVEEYDVRAIQAGAG